MRSRWLLLLCLAILGCEKREESSPPPTVTTASGGGLVYVPSPDRRTTSVTTAKPEPTIPKSVPTPVPLKTTDVPTVVKTTPPTVKTIPPVAVTPELPPMVVEIPSKNKSAFEPLDAGDAPFVHGRIALMGPWKVEKLSVGFVGRKADGTEYSNSAGTTLAKGTRTWTTSSTFLPQTTSLANHEKDGVSYRHVKLSPGDHFVYLRRDKVVVAWKRLDVKTGDQQSVDFNVDLTSMGELTVTLTPPEEPRTLNLIPAVLELGKHDESIFAVADVAAGQTRVGVAGVPAGKYRLRLGTDESAIEVLAGKETAANLAREKQ